MKPAFSAWREGLRYYVPPFVIGAVVLLLMPKGYTYYSLPLFILGFYILYFFRDPDRAITAASNEAVSPADGTVVGIERLASSPHYAGPSQRISIFLSVMNVHVNRSPLDGTVRDIRYQRGQFKNAMKAETSDCNESNTIRMETSFGPVTVRQISGAIARRIVCVSNVGETLAKGEKFGMIKLGSRTELYLPPNAELCVRMKQKVYGGTTVVARFP